MCTRLVSVCPDLCLYQMNVLVLLMGWSGRWWRGSSVVLTLSWYISVVFVFLLFCHVFLNICVCTLGTPGEDGILTRWWRILIRSNKMVMMAMVGWSMSIDGLIDNFRIFRLM